MVRWLLLEDVYVLTFNPSTLPRTLPIQRVLRALWRLGCRQKVVERGAPFFRAKEGRDRRGVGERIDT